MTHTKIRVNKISSAATDFVEVCQAQGLDSVEMIDAAVRFLGALCKLAVKPETRDTLIDVALPALVRLHAGGGGPSEETVQKMNEVLRALDNPPPAELV